MFEGILKNYEQEKKQIERENGKDFLKIFFLKNDRKN